MDILQEIWGILSRMAPYLLLGFSIAGILHALIPDELIYRHLSGRGIKPIVKAALAGVPLPLCSCSVIPVSAHLRRQGASKGATVSFLASTPTTGVDSILATYALLGPVFAVVRPLSALISGILAGTAVTLFDSGGNGHSDGEQACPDCRVSRPQGSTIPQKLLEALRYGFIELPGAVAKWLLIGIVAGGVISYIFKVTGYRMEFSNPVLAYLLVLAFSLPMYVCSMGSIPVAAALMTGGLSPGTALVLLIAGPATNTTTMSFVGGKLGRKTLLIYLSVIVLVSITSGLVVDLFLHKAAIGAGVTAHTAMFHNRLRDTIAAPLLLAILVYPIVKSFNGRKNLREAKGMNRKFFRVPDMSCEHCVRRIRSALSEINGVREVVVDLSSKLVIVDAETDIETLMRAIADAGYTPEVVEDVA